MTPPLQESASRVWNLGDGLTASLTSHLVKSPGFQIVSLVTGQAKLCRNEKECPLKHLCPLWVGRDSSLPRPDSDQALWFSLGGTACPLEELQDQWAALEEGQEPLQIESATAELQELVDLLWETPDHCPLRLMMAKGKSLVLLARVLEAVERSQEPPVYQVRLSSQDLERVREAREVLSILLQDPPSLKILARKVGLNELKLKAGFHHLWGKTVYGLLRTLRMETARSLLESGSCNVGEAANQVGYTNTSHFARAFHREFGSTPGAVLRSRTMANTNIPAAKP